MKKSLFSFSAVGSLTVVTIALAGCNLLVPPTTTPSDFHPGASGNTCTASNALQTDSSTFGFGASDGGSFTGTAWDQTNNILRLSTGTGYYTPTMVSGLKLWLDADAIGLSDGAAVSSWSDRSGEGNDAVQATVADQPVYKTSIINGHSVVRFDGTSDNLVTFTPPNVNSTFIVYSLISGASIGQNRGLFTTYAFSGGFKGYYYTPRNDSTYAYQLWVDGNTGYTSTPVGLATNSIFDLTSNGSVTNGFLNGTLQGTSSNPTTHQHPLWLGRSGFNSDFANADIAEVLIYDSALSDSDRQIVECYLANKYAIQMSRGCYAGTFTSRVMDAFSAGQLWQIFTWVATLPFYKALPDNGASETQANYPSLYDNGLTGNLMNGLAGLWHLDEASGTSGAGGVKDNSGNVTPKDGTPNGGVTFGSAGILSTAATFNGTNAYIPTANVPIQSVSMWINPTAQAQMAFFEGSKCNTTNQSYGLFIYRPNGTGNGTGSGFSTTYGVVLTFWGNDIAVPYDAIKSGWHHVAVSWNGATSVSISIDGSFPSGYIWDGGSGSWSGATSQPFTLPNGTPSPDTSQSMYVGAGKCTFWGTGSQYFTGLIDELAIWNRALSISEMLQLYRRGANRIKYQVRSCSDPFCAASSPSWLGPDGTNQTYFSELYNKTGVTDADTSGHIDYLDYLISGSVSALLPTWTFANFYGLTVNSSRYFQYRAILESDDPCTAGVDCQCNYGAGTVPCSPELKSVTVGPSHSTCP